MTELRVKAVADLSGVSVQTLHHYDRIGLLVPSHRAENGYRLYSERDLLRLQQIMSLKYFGFELSVIKRLIAEDSDVVAGLFKQAEVLREKAKNIAHTSEALDKVLKEIGEGQQIPWTTIKQLIEVYRMAEKLEASWVGEILTPEEVKQYAEIGARFESEPSTRQAFLAKRTELIQAVEDHLDQDPTSPEAQAIGAQWMELINSLYGPDNADLKQTIWEEGFKKGRVQDERALPMPVIQWMDKAIDAHYRTQIITVLSIAGQQGSQEAWDSLMLEMCGNSEKMRQEIIDAVLSHPEVSDKAKAWVQKKA